MLFGLANREGAKVKNGCGEYGAGFAIVDGVGEVIEGSCATGGDDGHFDGFADGPAPSETTFLAHSTASSPVLLRPPWV